MGKIMLKSYLEEKSEDGLGILEVGRHVCEGSEVASLRGEELTLSLRRSCWTTGKIGSRLCIIVRIWMDSIKLRIYIISTNQHAPPTPFLSAASQLC